MIETYFIPGVSGLEKLFLSDYESSEKLDKFS